MIYRNMACCNGNADLLLRVENKIKRTLPKHNRNRKEGEGVREGSEKKK